MEMCQEVNENIIFSFLDLMMPTAPCIFKNIHFFILKVHFHNEFVFLKIVLRKENTCIV